MLWDNLYEEKNSYRFFMMTERGEYDGSIEGG